MEPDISKRAHWKCPEPSETTLNVHKSKLCLSKALRKKTVRIHRTIVGKQQCDLNMKLPRWNDLNMVCLELITASAGALHLI